MDKRTFALIICGAFVLILFFGLILMPKRTSQQPASETAITPSTAGSSSGEDQQTQAHSSSQGKGDYGTGHDGLHSGGTGGAAPTARSSSAGSPPQSAIQAFSEEEIQKLREQREELRKAMYERKRDWVKDKAADESLNAKSRVRYRLKLIDGFRNGNDAYNRGDYVEAMKQYNAGLTDPNADANTRYLCYHQMRDIARLMKDADLYLEILKEQGLLIENEDLSGVGIEKSNRGTLAYKRRKLFVQALKGQDGLQNAIDEYCRENSLSARDREVAEQEFIADFEEWKTDFMSPG